MAPWGISMKNLIKEIIVKETFKKWSFVLLLGFLFTSMTFAQSPVGTWKTISDKTGKESGIIEIWEKDGHLFGKINKVLTESDGGVNLRCDQCTGEHKNAPIIGLTILKGLKKEDTNVWDSGQILDPDNGKYYKCKITLSKDNKELEVRGYIGFSLLGRSQTWYRLE